MSSSNRILVTGISTPENRAAAAICSSIKEPSEPVVSKVVEASSKVSGMLPDSAEVACNLGESNLLITEGESSLALVLRAVPLLVRDGKIGTLGSPFLPIVDKVQQAGYFKYTCK